MESPADFLARWQYTGLFAVIFVEEAGVPLPLPGDLFIAAMGFLAHGGRAAFAPTAAVVTTATVLGAALLYLVSRHAGRPLLVRLARRLGYTEEREARLEAWLTRRGAPAVVLGRLVPGLRIVMTVVAGALRLRQSTFALGTLVAGLVWATLYFWIGWALGAGYERVGGGGALASAWPAAVAIAIAASLALTWRVRARRAPRAEP
ncbi:DedA family protein [Anaeromyxobacter sp. SG66]|uniref:DedA family protein n=1 Tax=Anaeromyxobacter sp. SG66 TaxID=2925410 RepID=UPI001F563B75|nr:DedA family protein [Anaeromyxobacter sp. SG66]